MTALTIDTARVFKPLLEPARYKGAKGGRGSGKSHFFAELLVEDSLRYAGDYGEGLLSVCIREVQKDLRDSAKRLIEGKLVKLGLGEADGFKVFSNEIQTPKDGVIIFQGMQGQTEDSIKSLEGFGRAWIEEAQNIAESSLDLLRPTIRVKHSEIWASWNPRRRNDAIETLFDPDALPTGAVLIKTDWRDNPWFTDVLEQERQDCLKNKPEQYNHIWEGGFATILSGAYYAKQLQVMRSEGRIGNVAADPLMQIRAAWDIGGTGQNADNCVIWIYQIVGTQIRWLDYYEAQGQPLATHVNWLRANGYKDALCILPHDGVNHDKVYDVTYETALRSAGFDVQIVKSQGKGAAMKRVEVFRRLAPNMWFNEPKTKAGIETLGWYHAKKNEKNNVDLGPNHDWSSHCADAAGLACVAYEMPRDKSKILPQVIKRRVV